MRQCPIAPLSREPVRSTAFLPPLRFIAGREDAEQNAPHITK
jgi:hypothetical protein